VKRHHLDMTGMALSGVCFFHCMALPLLAGTLPVSLGFANDERIHLAILALAAIAASFAFRGALKPSNPRWPLAALALIGLSILTAALFLPDDIEAILSVTGGVCLAAAHLINVLMSLWRPMQATCMRPRARHRHRKTERSLAL